MESIARILPSRTEGTIAAPPSKSAAHRALICAALAGGGRIDGILPSADMRATLGAALERHHLPIADTATLDDYLPGVALDKKRSGTDIDLALLKTIGESFIYRLPVALLGGFLRGEEI